MAIQKLKSLLQFTGLVVGTPSVLPHGLQWNPDRAVVPDILTLDGDGYTVTADATNVTVTRGSTAADAVNVLCESWHTFERAFGATSTVHLTPQPIVVQSGSGGGGGGGSIAVTDDTTTVDPTTTLVMDPTSGFAVHDDGGGTARVTLASTAIISTARYTASGSETAAGFDINLTALGIAQPNANFNAIVTGGGMAFVLSFDVDQSLNTAVKIHVIPSANLTADDVLVVTLIPFVPV